ncbi:MAG: transcription antitermination factor NusB [Azospirillaceae bacterium]
MASEESPKPTPKARRSAARLAAVQGLYQIAQTGQDVERVLGEFVKYRFGGDMDGETYVTPDPALFGDIVRGTRKRQAEIDRVIDEALRPPWSATRLELLLRIVLRAAVWELLANPDAPAPIVIDEYVNLGHAFFSGSEPGMINGVLDRLAHLLRAEEFDRPAGER